MGLSNLGDLAEWSRDVHVPRLFWDIKSHIKAFLKYEDHLGMGQVRSQNGCFHAFTTGNGKPFVGPVVAQQFDKYPVQVPMELYLHRSPKMQVKSFVFGEISASSTTNRGGWNTSFDGTAPKM